MTLPDLVSYVVSRVVEDGVKREEEYLRVRRRSGRKQQLESS